MLLSSGKKEGKKEGEREGEKKRGKIKEAQISSDIPQNPCGGAWQTQ